MSVPEKYFYTIGDVAEITKIKPHVLRYWENHFKVLRPARRYSGHRKYTQREIELINQIRHLVVDRKFTLNGAKREIHRQINGKASPGLRGGASAKPENEVNRAALLRDIKKDVEDCLRILEPKPNPRDLVSLKS